MSGSSGKMSLFAQRMKQQREEKSNIEVLSKPEKKPVTPAAFGSGSRILTGSEASEIHQENVQKLACMSEEEIMEERSKILSELDPGLVQFLRSKKVRLDEVFEEKMEESDEHQKSTVEEVPEINVEEVEDVKSLANKFPHMDVVEKEKLGWIGEMKKPEAPPPDSPYQARFNFEGELLPFCDDGVGVLKGLHNHGKEQERPGYSIEELFQLSRSSVLQQRVIAINTLSNIMAHVHSYEDCFLEPFLPILLNSEVFLLLRLSLDDLSVPVVMSSISAISNLLVNHVDEACLDVSLGTSVGLQQPSFGILLDLTETEVAELKDAELWKLDLIRGTLRTNLLHRLRYILIEMKPEALEIKHIIKILIRISRHSVTLAETVYRFPELMDAVRSLLDRREGKSYYPEALKLFRIMAATSDNIARDIVNNYDILKPIFLFISGDKATGHPELMQLTLESFYTWQCFLTYDIAPYSIGEMTPVLMRLLEAHFGLTNIDGPKLDLEHGTAIISTLTAVAKDNILQITFIFPFILNLAQKWITQFMNLQKAASYFSSKLLGSVLNFFAVVYSSVDNIHTLTKTVSLLLESHGFNITLDNLKKSSWLLQGSVRPSPDCLPCLGSIPPLLNDDSCIPFVSGLANFILASKKNQLMDTFISHPSISGYVQAVQKNSTKVTSVSGHWHARQEINLLTCLVNIFTSSKKSFSLEDLYHNISFNLLTWIQCGDKHLLINLLNTVIFDPKYYRLDVTSISNKMEELNLNQDSQYSKSQVLSQSLSHIQQIQAHYMDQLGVGKLVRLGPPDTLTGLINCTQPAIPSDWPYLPILRMYNAGSDASEEGDVVQRCLEWILILEELHPKVANLTDVTARYCRMCCVYLAGDSLYRDVTPLLDAILDNLLKYSSALNFEKPIPGLTSFYDFYRQVVEQYVAVSYCDETFGRYVLVPLQQRHHPKYKKLIWYEMGSVLRVLRTPCEKVNMDDYLYPIEEDLNLIQTYRKAIGSGKMKEVWCPVLYKVAAHHASSFVDAKKKACEEAASGNK